MVEGKVIIIEGVTPDHFDALVQVLRVRGDATVQAVGLVLFDSNLVGGTAVLKDGDLTVSILFKPFWMPMEALERSFEVAMGLTGQKSFNLGDRKENNPNGSKSDSPDRGASQQPVDVAANPSSLSPGNSKPVSEESGDNRDSQR